MTARKRRISVEDYKPFLTFIRENTVRLFKTRADVESYLHKEVFSLEDFKNNVNEVSAICNISPDLANTIITNHLIDMLYEIDKRQSHTVKKKKSRICISGFMEFDTGFISALAGKRFTKVTEIKTHPNFKKFIKNYYHERF